MAIRCLVCKDCGRVYPWDYDGLNCEECGGEIKDTLLTFTKTNGKEPC